MLIKSNEKIILSTLEVELSLNITLKEKCNEHVFYCHFLG